MQKFIFILFVLISTSIKSNAKTKTYLLTLNFESISSVMTVDTTSEFIILDKGYKPDISEIKLHVFEFGSNDTQMAFFGFADRSKRKLWQCVTDKQGSATITYFSRNSKEAAYLVVYFLNYSPAYIPLVKLKDRDVEITVKLKWQNEQAVH
ncbi:hypothetical protein [Pedobacter duraquae]|uniref:Uncharacterized protein n=1 Tax=Pedobacter duraquae TaxID=425511 RepID=A0A4R6IG21_9SPHI|nr:hypothetical protein [Pedobacter duraquae]TDO21300.1 hypothetical protein CLV32_2404 [Pedobacter duraquae]